MRRILAILGVLLLCAAQAGAQELKDSVKVNDVFSGLSDSLRLTQPESVRDALVNHVSRNSRRTALGITDQSYRIRIYFDNSQQARAGSEEAVDRFKLCFPGVAVNRTYEKPFFKVTVGNYATKAEANAALKRVQTEFPSAFIVRK